MKKFKIKKRLLFKSLNEFKGLKYRQQVIFRNSKVTIINDSKSTSFSSSLGILKTKMNIYWILGGISKKGDKFNLQKKYHNRIKAFVFGRNKKFFKAQLKGKIKYENFNNIKDAFEKALIVSKIQKSTHKIIIFSPSAASFDSFKNFEERGLYFNKLVKKYLNV